MYSSCSGQRLNPTLLVKGSTWLRHNIKQRTKVFVPELAELGLLNDLMHDRKEILPFHIPFFG